MLIKCDFNLEAWISSVEIEADDEDEAKEKLMSMSLEELAEAHGYMIDKDITKVDTQIIEATYRVKVMDIDYDITEDDVDFQTDDIENEIETIRNGLPKELILDVSYSTSYEIDLDELVIEAITDETGYLVKSATYDILYTK